MSAIIPAILTDNLDDFSKELDLVGTFPDVNEVQVDFADNIFVQNKTLNPAQIPSLPLKFEFTAHLMVENPSKYLADLERAGFEKVAVHLEAFLNQEECKKTLDQIRELSFEPQLAINPDTNLESVFPFLKDLNTIVVMSVKPGFYGSKYKKETPDRIRSLRLHDFYGTIIVDGGVDKDKVKDLLSAGADYLVVGSKIFKSERSLDSYRQLLSESEK